VSSSHAFTDRNRRDAPDWSRLDAQFAQIIQNLYDADDFDFRLVTRSAAADSGTRLPNVNDGFTGRAPDLGALEVGVSAPHNGPRS